MKLLIFFGLLFCAVAVNAQANKPDSYLGPCGGCASGPGGGCCPPSQRPYCNDNGGCGCVNDPVCTGVSAKKAEVHWSSSEAAALLKPKGSGGQN